MIDAADVPAVTLDWSGKREMFVIYRLIGGPLSGRFAVRHWMIEQGKPPSGSPHIRVFRSLTGARKAMPPEYICHRASLSDALPVVEQWLEPKGNGEI